VSGPSSLDPERRAGLLAAKLRALVREHTGQGDGETGGHAGAATLLSQGCGWFLAAERPERAVGPALAWARQQGADELHVLVDDAVAAGVVARRAALFTGSPQVWSVDDRRLRATAPAPHAADVDLPAEVGPMVALLEGAGVDVVVEHGRVTGEVRGLEIAQVVSEPGGLRLEVGVGRHDRDAFTMLHGDVPAARALAAVADAARPHRTAGGHGHPLGRLVPERWLRWRVLGEPGLAGAAHLEPLPPILPRASVKDVVPAGAVGHDDQGRPVVVACSVGVDLDLVPEAADLRDRWEHESGADARLVLVLPARDALPVTRDLAGALARPASVVAVPGDWRSDAGDGPAP
jgi:hypothetical protein